MTTREAAHWCGFSNPSRIRQLILGGKLKAEKHGRDWLLKPEDVKEYADGMRLRFPHGKEVQDAGV